MKDHSGNHILYNRHQVMGACIELRFPPILQIASETPAEFQESIRDNYPNYQFQVLHVNGDGMMQVDGAENPMQVPAHIFATEDMGQFITISPPFFSISCGPHRYPGWDIIMKSLDKPLYSFIRKYAPKNFTRVGLRFINAFSPCDLGLDGYTWRDLIQPQYLGVLTDSSISNGDVIKSTVEVERKINKDYVVKIYAGPGYMNKFDGHQVIQENVQKFFFDIDVSCAKTVGIDGLIPSMAKAHELADELFAGAITDVLHEAMQPVIVH